MNVQPIQTALCSFGMSGWVFHAPFIDTYPGFNLYAVVERSKNLAVEKYPAVVTYRSLEEMLADEKVELVVVNTPNYTHYEFAKKALEAGKHVLVEKPFTVEVAQADELIAIAKQKNRRLAVYQNRRWDSDYKTVKRIIEEKWVGDIVEAEFHFDRFSEALSVKQHKETPGPGAGILYDLGSHLIDQALHLFGMPKMVFADVTAMRPISKVDDYFELLMDYGHFRVRLKGSYQVKEILPSYIIHGSAGSFIKSRADVQEADLQRLKPLSDADWGQEPETGKGVLNTVQEGRLVIASETGNYLGLYDGLYKAIREGAVLPVTAEEGRDVIRVIAAAYASVAEKKWVSIG